MTQFLLTGGSGFIGQHLARFLGGKGHAVRALVRRTSKREGLERAGATFVEGDVATPQGLDAALEGVECVIHLAGATKGRTAEDYFRANAEGTRNLALAISRMPRPARLVYVSSLAAVGPSRIGAPHTEHQEPAPLSTYGRSKLAGEMAVRQFAEKVPSVIVRPPIVYGPADREFIANLLPFVRAGVVPKSGFGPKHYSLIHVDDLCEGLLAAATKGSTISSEDPVRGVYFISDSGQHSWEQVCDALALAVGKGRARVLPLPDILSYLAGLGGEVMAKLRGTVAIMNRDKAREMRCEAWTCSGARAREEMNFMPIHDLKSGFAHTVGWFRQEGWL